MEGQVTDLNNASSELQSLQQQLNDLQTKYNELESDHNSYKFGIEFNKDISSSGINPSDEDLEVLKDLKLNGNEKAYDLLLNKLRPVSPVNTGGLGNFTRNFNETNIKQEPKEYGFEQAIQEIKGDN